MKASRKGCRELIFWLERPSSDLVWGVTVFVQYSFIYIYICETDRHLNSTWKLVLKKFGTDNIFSCINSCRDTEAGTHRGGRQTANMLVCMCLSGDVSERKRLSVRASCLPGGEAFILYLQAQTGGLIVFHISLTPLCSPTPDGHSSVPYHSDYLRKHCCEVKTLWSQGRQHWTWKTWCDCGSVFSSLNHKTFEAR